MAKDITILVSGFLSSLFLFLTSINVKFEWFNETSIDAFVVLVGAAVALVLNLYAIWKNTYVTKKEQTQKEVLERNNLIK